MAQAGTAALRLESRIAEEREEVDYTLLNEGPGDATIGVWSCGYAENWTTDNPNVRIRIPDSRGCDKNFCKTIVLKPSESTSGSLRFVKRTTEPMRFNLRFKSCHGRREEVLSDHAKRSVDRRRPVPHSVQATTEFQGVVLVDQPKKHYVAIINGTTAEEGETIYRDIKVIKITPEEVVLEHGGKRFTKAIKKYPPQANKR